MAKIDFGGTVDKTTGRVKGLVSGVDTESLIDAAVEKRRKPVVAAEEALTINTNKCLALGQLNRSLTNFQNVLSTLRGPRFADDTVNALGKRVVTYNAQVSNPTAYVNVAAQSDVAVGQFSVQVTQLALSHVLQSVSFPSTTAAVTNTVGGTIDTNMFTPGVFTINGTAVTVASGDSLTNISSKINWVSGSTNVTAQVIKPTLGSAKIILQSKLTGAANAIVLGDPDAVLNNVFKGSNAVLQVAQDATFIYNNSITVQRPTNVISDFIDGLSFTLYNPTTTGQTSFSINVSVTPSVEDAASAIVELVNQYNEFITFMAKQQARDDAGRYLEYAYIQYDEYLNNLVENIVSVACSLGDVLGLTTSLGITVLDETPPTDKEPSYYNMMAVDLETLQTALAQNFSNVCSLFQFQISGDTQNIIVQQSGNNITQQSFQIVVATDNDGLTTVGAICNGSTIPMKFVAVAGTSYGILKGMPGTLLDGYQFYYTGALNATLNLTISQGIADKIANLVQGAIGINPSTGLSVLQQNMGYLNSDNMDLRERIARETQSVEEYKKQQIDKFSKMEAALAKANNTLTFLEIQLKHLGNKT